MTQEEMNDRKPFRILELYSGVGGMHVAAKESGLPFDIVGSYEINTTALEVYRHNFPKTPKAFNILGLTLEKLTSIAPDIIMMSPPCQPFTRQGLKRDVEDVRTSSLLHLLKLLEEVSNPPQMILLENVAGFEKSLARQQLIEMLTKRKYIWQELLLSPTEFGIPNSRLRYYLLAKLQPGTFCFNSSNKVDEQLPLCLCVESCNQDPSADTLKTCKKCGKPHLNSLHSLLQRLHSDVNPNFFQPDSSYSEISPSLCHYLQSEINIDPYLLKDKILTKYIKILDIVDKNSKSCCCFTKGYGHYVEGTGSVIKQNVDVDLADIYARAEKLSVENPDRLELLHQLKLRYFTAEEIARLMCFPSWFSFPQSVSIKQKYKVLGNSINILVVTSLLLMLCER